MRTIITLLLILTFGTSVKAQTNVFSSVVLSELTTSADTTLGSTNYQLGFNLTFNELNNIQSLSLKLINNSGSTVSNVGDYSIVAGSNNFYYLNSSTNDKKSIMGNQASFLKKINASEYNATSTLKLEVTMSDGSIQTLIKTLSK